MNDLHLRAASTSATDTHTARRISPPSSPDSRRALLLYALGSVLGLAIAGYALLTARGTETRHLPEEDVALINQQPILRSDFITQTESETGLTFDRTSHAQRLRVLDEMVQEELKVQRGLELNFAETDQDTRNALANVVDQQIVAEVTTSQPSEQQLHDYYEAHRDQFHTPGVMTVCDMWLPGGNMNDGTQSTAVRAAVAQIRSGAALAQVLPRYGLVNRNQCEDNFYFAIKIHLGDQLHKLAAQMPGGSVSDPIQASDGIHVVQMLKNVMPVADSYVEARSQLEGEYRMEREDRVRTGTMNFLRGRSKMLIADDYRDYSARP
jgi:hypothetical protein